MNKAEKESTEIGLVVGVHGAENEIGFVRRVVEKIRESGYSGPIQLVGSRSRGSWLSTHAFDDECCLLSPEEYQNWYEYLNNLMRGYMLEPVAIASLRNLVSRPMPEAVEDFLNTGTGSSDFDLVIEEERTDLDGYYVSEDGKTLVEIFVGDEYFRFIEQNCS